VHELDCITSVTDQVSETLTPTGELTVFKVFLNVMWIM